MTSESNSVTSVTNVGMLPWALNASMSQMQREDELPSIDERSRS